MGAGSSSEKIRDLSGTLGCDGVINVRGIPLQVGARWVIERIDSRHNRELKKLAICTEVRSHVINAFTALANTIIIIIRHPVTETWTSRRWKGHSTHGPCPTRPISQSKRSRIGYDYVLSWSMTSHGRRTQRCSLTRKEQPAPGSFPVLQRFCRVWDSSNRAGYD